MPSFGKESRTALDTCDPRLQKIAEKAIEIMDFSVLEGHRTKERQDELYNENPPKTKVQWPNSKHNTIPSRAFDIAPYPIDWKDIRRFYILAGVIRAVAHELGIKLRWGGDWDSDDDLKDQTFNDLPHFELVD